MEKWGYDHARIDRKYHQTTIANTLNKKKIKQKLPNDNNPKENLTRKWNWTKKITQMFDCQCALKVPAAHNTHTANNLIKRRKKHMQTRKINQMIKPMMN